MTAFNLRDASPLLDGGLLSRAPGSPASPREVTAQPGLLGRTVGAWAARVREHVRRQRVMAELSRLTDRELADIGLSRSEIGLIYTAEFVARRSAERRG